MALFVLPPSVSFLRFFFFLNQFETNWNLLGEGPQLRSCLLQVGLWASPWEMFLINDF